MEQRRLGPMIGLGTYRTFDGDAATATAMVDAALASGVTTFDSSPMYGRAQASLGAALDSRRNDTTVATKIWTPSVEEGRAQYDEQRRYFGRVEIEQVHNLVAWHEHLPWLEEERPAGRIDRIGVTHWSAGSFGELEQALRDASLRRRPAPVQSAGARGRGAPAPARGGARSRRRRHAAVRRHGRAAPAASAAGEGARPLRDRGINAWAQALLKWTLSDPRVDVVIPATSRPERAEENAEAGSPPWLDDDERAYVARLAYS